MSHEMLRQYDELAQQAVEAAGRFDNELPPGQEQQTHVHLGEHHKPHADHHIEHDHSACGVDHPEHHQPHIGNIGRNPDACCPDHGNHDHAETHNHIHDDHDHRHPSHESQPKPHIELNPNACCPNYGSAHTHESDHKHDPTEAHTHHEHRAHHESDHKHTVEQKLAELHQGAQKPDYVEVEQHEPGQDHVLAYQKVDEAIRRSQQAEADTRVRTEVAEYEALVDNKTEPAPERVITRTDSADDMPETERAFQNEPRAISRQPEDEIFVAAVPIIPETSMSAVNITEAPVEPLLPDEAPAAVEMRLVDIADPNPAPIPGIQVVEAEVASLAEAPAISGVELVQPSDVMELSDGTEEIAYTEMLGDVEVEGIEAPEPFEDIGIARIELPMPEPVQEAYQYSENIEPFDIRVDQANMVESSQPGAEQVPPGYEQAAQGLAELISQRIDAEARQQQLLRLLLLLGYENPSQTLKAYIHQYGIDFVGELQAKLLELLGQGRVYESLPTSSFAPAAALPGSDTSALGTLALTLARLRGYLFPTTSGA